jgi:hypothetical protein
VLASILVLVQAVIGIGERRGGYTSSHRTGEGVTNDRVLRRARARNLEMIMIGAVT